MIITSNHKDGALWIQMKGMGEAIQSNDGTLGCILLHPREFKLGKYMIKNWVLI